MSNRCSRSAYNVLNFRNWLICRDVGRYLFRFQFHQKRIHRAIIQFDVWVSAVLCPYNEHRPLRLGSRVDRDNDAQFAVVPASWQLNGRLATASYLFACGQVVVVPLLVCDLLGFIIHCSTKARLKCSYTILLPISAAVTMLKILDISKTIFCPQ